MCCILKTKVKNNIGYVFKIKYGSRIQDGRALETFLCFFHNIGIVVLLGLS